MDRDSCANSIDAQSVSDDSDADSTTPLLHITKIKEASSEVWSRARGIWSEFLSWFCWFLCKIRWFWSMLHWLCLKLSGMVPGLRYIAMVVAPRLFSQRIMGVLKFFLSFETPLLFLQWVRLFGIRFFNMLRLSVRRWIVLIYQHTGWGYGGRG